jgi:hypothetical protein
VENYVQNMSLNYFVDCPESALGTLSGYTVPPPTDTDKFTQKYPLDINGIDLPLNVIRELSRLGRPLAWYTRGELRAATIACAPDGNLVDDPEGANFDDMLTLTNDEKKKREKKPNTFCEELELERERQKHQLSVVAQDD